MSNEESCSLQSVLVRLVKCKTNWTHVDVDVSKSDSGVCDEACIEGIEVCDRLHVGNEGGGHQQEHNQDHSNYKRMEPGIKNNGYSQISGTWKAMTAEIYF